MGPADLLEVVASELGDVLPGVVYFGGTVVPLHFDAELLGGNEPRPTDDVDVLVMFEGSELAFHDFERALHSKGWRPNASPEKRLKFAMISPSGVQVDLVPLFMLSGEDVCREALPFAVELRLGSGRVVKVLSSAGLLAAKFSAFEDRGAGDVLGSPDFEDIAMLVGCVPGLVEDAGRLSGPLRQRIAAGAEMLGSTDVVDYAAASIPRNVPVEQFLATLDALVKVGGVSR